MRLLTYFQADTTDFPTGSVCMQFEEFQWLDLFVDRCEKRRKHYKVGVFLFFCLFVCLFVFWREIVRERESTRTRKL